MTHASTFPSAAASRLDPWRSIPAVIKRVVHEAARVKTYDIEVSAAHHNPPFLFKPGQFNMIYVPGVGEAAISIAGYSKDRTCLRHTIRTVGAVTQAMEQGGVGMALGIRGPFGTCWPLASESVAVHGPDKELVAREDRVAQVASPKPDVIVAAGGLGLAPLRSMVLHLLEYRTHFENVHLLLGARSPAELLYKYELDDWQKSGMHVVETVDQPLDGWKGHVGVVTLLLERLTITRPESTVVMTCGPEVMMRYVAKSSMNLGISPSNIWVTLERNMNCAIGICGHCQLGPAILCRNGPVFRYDQVQDWLKVEQL